MKFEPELRFAYKAPSPGDLPDPGIEPGSPTLSGDAALPSVLPGKSLLYSLEGLMLKLKLQYFGHLMLRADSFEKTLMLGKIEGRKLFDITQTHYAQS